MFRKILIANRGEIAVRIAKTARRMGIRTVAVYSDADMLSPHVRACDDALHIGGAAPADSYLRIDRLLDAARKSEAQAIHPGYGFLSENAAFAQATEDSGLAFIGPSPETIRAMGSKASAKSLVSKAGVPVTPGYQGDDQSLETLSREAELIGFPVLLKASAGGGGKGMRLVHDRRELAAAIQSAQREALSAFGDAALLIEKYLERARHVEVQIFGDGKGDVVHLFDRDCSIQRRHQKIIEEAPAPGLSDAVRSRLLTAGVDAGRAVSYRGAGTVEFLYDGDAGVYFMEMNTRLQVEHPVTEAITGIDLVEWQFRIAAGEQLPLRQSEIEARGHAFEARLCAEDPDRDFAPSTGSLTLLRLPHELARIDAGVEQGQAISPYYDPMVAKIITHAPTRSAALAQLSRALEKTRVTGVHTNTRFLHAISTDVQFEAEEISTRYIEEHRTTLFARPACDERVLAAAICYLSEPMEDSVRSGAFEAPRGFQLNRTAHIRRWIEIDNEPAMLRIERGGSGGTVHATIEHAGSIEARKSTKKNSALSVLNFVVLQKKSSAPAEWLLTMGGSAFDATVVPLGAGIRVYLGADYWDFALPNPVDDERTARLPEGSLKAPMPGVITKLSVTPGDRVEAGNVILLMEAMKMEHAVKAPASGTLTRFRFGVGSQVRDGDLLAEIAVD